MRPLTDKDANGAVTTNTYDFIDRILTKTISTAYKETFEYDDTYSGTLSKVTKTVEGGTNAPSIKTVAYTNRFGFVVKSGYVINDAEVLNTFTYDYLGNMITSK